MLEAINDAHLNRFIQILLLVHRLAHNKIHLRQNCDKIMAMKSFFMDEL